jgi:hypothetical protein
LGGRSATVLQTVGIAYVGGSDKRRDRGSMRWNCADSDSLWGGGPWVEAGIAVSGGAISA